MYRNVTVIVRRFRVGNYLFRYPLHSSCSDLCAVSSFWLLNRRAGVVVDSSFPYKLILGRRMMLLQIVRRHICIDEINKILQYLILSPESHRELKCNRNHLDPPPHASRMIHERCWKMDPLAESTGCNVEFERWAWPSNGGNQQIRTRQRDRGWLYMAYGSWAVLDLSSI